MGDLILISQTTERERLENRLAESEERAATLRAQAACIARQFVDDDLRVTAGPRAGQPLTRRGRQQRMNGLLAKLREAGWVQRDAQFLRKKIHALEREHVASNSDDWGA